MTDEVIINEFDTPQTDKALEKLEKNPYFEYELPIDQIQASDLEKCEHAIRSLQSFTEATNTAMAVAVRHIVENRLFKDAGYETHSEYFAAADGRLGMSKQKASVYLKSGYAFYDYRDKLDDAGFRPEGDYSKLVFLEAAIEQHGEPEAIKSLCSMTWREYKEYASGPEPKRLNYTKLDLEVSVTEKGISVEGKPVVKLADVKKIVDKGSEPYLIGLESAGEKAAITRFLKEFRSKK